MSLMRQIEWNLNTKRREARRARMRDRREFPDPVMSWQRRGAVVEAFVIRSRLRGTVDTYFRLGTTPMTRNGPSYSAFFPATVARDLEELLVIADRWFRKEGPHSVRNKLGARQWKRACAAQPLASATNVVSTSELGPIQCLAYEVCSTSGRRQFFYRFRHRTSHGTEELFRPIEIPIAKLHLRSVWAAHVDNSIERSKSAEFEPFG